MSLFVFQVRVVIKNVPFFTLILLQKLKIALGMTEDSVNTVSSLPNEYTPHLKCYLK